MCKTGPSKQCDIFMINISLFRVARVVHLVRVVSWSGWSGLSGGLGGPGGPDGPGGFHGLNNQIIEKTWSYSSNQNSTLASVVPLAMFESQRGGGSGRSGQDLKYFPLHFGVWLPIGPRQLISSTLLGQLQPDFLLSHQLFSTSPLVTAVLNPA